MVENLYLSRPTSVSEISRQKFEILQDRKETWVNHGEDLKARYPIDKRGRYFVLYDIIACFGTRNFIDLGTASGKLLCKVHEEFRMPFEKLFGVSAKDHRPQNCEIPDDSYIIANIDELHLFLPRKRTYSLIWSSATFYHLVDPIGTLQAVYSFLDPQGGLAVIRHVPLAAQLGVDNSTPFNQFCSRLEKFWKSCGYTAGVCEMFDKPGFCTIVIHRTVKSPEALQLPYEFEKGNDGLGKMVTIGGKSGWKYAKIREIDSLLSDQSEIVIEKKSNIHSTSSTASLLQCCKIPIYEPEELEKTKEVEDVFDAKKGLINEEKVKANKVNFMTIAFSYCTLTLTDGALRTIILLHAAELGFDAIEIATMFMLYELMGIITNLFGGYIASRVGLRWTCLIGLSLQSLVFFLVSPISDIFGNDYSNNVTRWSTTIYITFIQAFAGVAKDLLKISGKSVTKLVNEKEKAGSDDKLFNMVAYLTGAKNSLKGVGHFLGGVVLIGNGKYSYMISCISIGLLPLIPLPFVFLYTDPQLGKDTTKRVVTLRDIITVPRDLLVLSVARFFLFASRDVWFEVAAPIFLKEVLNWDDFLVSAFMGGYIIVYGKLQVFCGYLLLKPLGCFPPQSVHVLPWTAILGLVSAGIGAVYLGIHKNDVGSILEWQKLKDTHTSITNKSNYSDMVKNLSIATPIMFLVFAIIMAVISAIHSYLVVAFSPKNRVAKNVGFYYMANAGGRLIGTMLSGVLYEVTVDTWGISFCCFIAALFLLVASVASKFLNPVPDVMLAVV